MIHLVAYDICNHKRLYRIAKTCCDFGVRVEKSVFECDLPDKRFAEFWRKLNKIINPETDSLIAYPIGAGEIVRIQTAGVIKRPEKQLVYVF